MFCSRSVIDYTCFVQRNRKQKGKRTHLCLLVNESATNYDGKAVEQLIDRTRKIEGHYTILRPSSALDLADAAKAACGLRRPGRFLTPQFARRGPVTGMVAIGGDGTFNLVARAALRAELPVGVIPVGRFNNIAESLYGSTDHELIINKILEKSYCMVDVGTVAGLNFFGSVGLGLWPELQRQLENRRLPRFGIGWARVGNAAARATRRRKTIITIDSFQFELSPALLGVSLLPRTLGLPFAGAALTDDGCAEVIFDVDASSKDLGSQLRLLSKNKYNYESIIRLFRGQSIMLQPTKDRTLYLDGELVDLPSNMLDIQIDKQKLKVFC